NSEARCEGYDDIDQSSYGLGMQDLSAQPQMGPMPTYVSKPPSRPGRTMGPILGPLSGFGKFEFASHPLVRFRSKPDRRDRMDLPERRRVPRVSARGLP